jgi:hypothetical protein
VYRKDLELKINPFHNRNGFKATVGPELRKGNSILEMGSPEEDDLSFDSNFESGNLLSAEREVGRSCYHLMMQNDINTFGCTQWFFFKTVNKNRGGVTFSINNFYKPHSLYQKGMKVLILSMKKFESEGVGWSRGGEDFMYFRNRITEVKQNGVSK